MVAGSLELLTKWMTDEKRPNGEILGNTSRQWMGRSETGGVQERSGKGKERDGKRVHRGEPQELRAETVLRRKEQSRPPCAMEC